MMEQQIIEIGGAKIAVPDYYRQVESMPEDPPGSVPLMAQTDNATAFVMLEEIDGDHAMPFDGPQTVIDGIHQSLAESQGLIEVIAEKNEHGDFIYSIVKTLRDEEDAMGNQYTLVMDAKIGKSIVHVQGFFDEVGMTGVRDSTVFSALDPELDFEERMSIWRRDPYDPSFTHGHLMNRSEQQEYDAMFPAHPLSLARAFAKAIMES